MADRGRVILVIDDDATITDLLTRVLTADGYTVVTAADGTSGLQLAEQHRPDLIIMDITMPDMDGYQATTRLKENPTLADVPVVFLSGKSPAEDGGRSFATGAITFLRKPLRIQQIRDIVRLALESMPG